MRIGLLACLLVAALATDGIAVAAASASRAPKASERAALAKALKVPARCLKMRVATVRSGWASLHLKVPLPKSCLRYAADGVVVMRKGAHGWRMRFAGSSWKCPI